jgi:hypothetical protein
MRCFFRGERSAVAEYLPDSRGPLRRPLAHLGATSVGRLPSLSRIFPCMRQRLAKACRQVCLRIVGRGMYNLKVRYMCRGDEQCRICRASRLHAAKSKRGSGARTRNRHRSQRSQLSATPKRQARVFQQRSLDACLSSLSILIDCHVAVLEANRPRGATVRNPPSWRDLAQRIAHQSHPSLSTNRAGFTEEWRAPGLLHDAQAFYLGRRELWG